MGIWYGDEKQEGRSYEQVANPVRRVLEEERILFKRAKDGDTEARNSLAEKYLSLVKTISRNIARELPRSVDVEDLEQEGTIGLIKGIETYDETKSSPKTWIGQKVWGAIFDYVVNAGQVSRGATKMHRRVERRVKEIKATTGRVPSLTEVIDELDLSSRYREEFLGSFAVKNQRSLTPAMRGRRNSFRRVDHTREVPQTTYPGPVDAAIAKETAGKIREILEGSLCVEDHTIFTRYFFDRFLSREVARVIGWSDSGITNRLNKKILPQVRAIRSFSKMIGEGDGVRKQTPSLRKILAAVA